MSAPAVKVEGAREVRRSLRKLGEGTRDMTAIHRAVAEKVLPVAVGRTRRGRTGKLAGAYRIRASAAKVAMSNSMVYAPVQEFGWPARGITASNALVGAIEDSRGVITDTYTKAVADLVERVQAGHA